MKKLIESKIQRVRLRFVDPTNGNVTISRRTKQCRISTFADGTVEYKLLPAKIITKDNVVLEWVHGPTPTPKPSKKYSEEQLKSFGYSNELIKTIHRGYSSKDIEKVCKKFKDKETGKRMCRSEAKELLDKYKFISKIPANIKTGSAFNL